MRRWLVVLGIVVALVAGALVLAATNLEGYLNRNRGAVAERLSQLLGREVSFGSVGISLGAGLAVRAEDLRVGDDPAFSEGDFVRAAAVDVGVKLLPALLGRIEVARVVLRAPEIQLVQTDRGLSTDSLGGGGKGGGGEAAEAEGPGAAPVALVSLLDVRDGALRYVDRRAKPPVEVVVEQLDVDASDLSLDEPVEFEASAAVLGAERRNLEVSGRVGPLSSDDPAVDLELRLDPVALETLAPFFPAGLTGSGPVVLEAKLEGTPEALSITGAFDAGSAQLRQGEGFEKAAGVPLDLAVQARREGPRLRLESGELRLGSTSLAGSGTFTEATPPELEFALRSERLRPRDFGAGGDEDSLRDLELAGRLALASAGPRGQVRLRSASGTLASTPFRDLVVELALEAGRIGLSSLTAKLFEGGVVASGSLATASTPPRMSAKTKLEGMQTEAILAHYDLGAHLTGVLEADLDVAGAGSDWEELQPRLTGHGRFAVQDGVLRRFNPAAGALRAVAALPTTRGAGLRRVIDAHPRVFGIEDTPFESFRGQLEIRDGWVYAREVKLDTPDYEVAGGGRYSFDGELEFQTQMVFSPEISAELVEAEPSFRYARKPDGRVELPVALRGRPPRVAVVPDLSRLGAAAARQAITDELQKALGGGAAEEAPAEGAEPGAEREPATPPTAEDLGRELLRQGLGGLLGGKREADPPAQ